MLTPQGDLLERNCGIELTERDAIRDWMQLLGAACTPLLGRERAQGMAERLDGGGQLSTVDRGGWGGTGARGWGGTCVRGHVRMSARTGAMNRQGLWGHVAAGDMVVG